MMFASKHRMVTAYVLIVEDDALTRGIVSEVFRNNYRVREAGDVAGALAIIEAQGFPAVVLSDIVMPDAPGRLFREYVRTLNEARVPLAFVTGSPDLAPAGSTVFCKPTTLQILLRFVDAQLGVGART